MPTPTNFRARIGAVNMPEATEIVGDDDVDETLVASIGGRLDPGMLVPDERDSRLHEWWRWRICRTTLKEGCYRLTYRPTGTPWWGNHFVGTVRIEHRARGRYRISGDLYRSGPFFKVPWKPGVGGVLGRLDVDGVDTTDAAETTGGIPIYPRRKYHSYLEGTGAETVAIVPRKSKCSVTLSFDEWDYTHPATGFSGTFPASATRSIRYVLSASGNDSYSGTAYSGSTALGTVGLTWVSSSFRRANLEVRRLTGAELPPDVGTHDFATVFESAGWDLSVTKITTAMSKPASLSSQSATDCWSTANLHRLMQAVPGYDPTVLDTQWKAYLLAVPADMGCSRGVMFDSSGDLNDIKREGAGTFSHDGFPASHSSNFGDAEDELMKDHPRAFLRSAAHEVGHTFNQIHQTFEGGSDNSIMTVTPSVADVLAASGGSFPDDIALEFNATVRRHLIHLPDPAVRPGAMGFFGAAINAPEADHVAELDELEVTVTADSDSVRLGEPLSVSWTMTNRSDESLPVPERITAPSLAARVSVTGPRGDVTFIRPVDIETCSGNSIVELDAGADLTSESVVFYGTDGFAFTEPGRHVIDVTILWEVGGAHLMTSGSTDVWVAYPLTDNDNRIASLLLDPAVGEAVALGDPELAPGAAERIREAAGLQEAHPACAKLGTMGLTAKATGAARSGSTPTKKAPAKKRTATKRTAKQAVAKKAPARRRPRPKTS